MTLRTTRGREKTVVNSLQAQIENDAYAIDAVLYPHDLKGYVFIEGDEVDIRDIADNLRHVKGVIDKDVDLEELDKFLSDEPQEIKLEPGDTVEVIGGPFKGEEAEIDRIDEANQEATIKLLEAAVPIPVTISVELLRKRSEE
ncbi:MAG: transcription elongation factor Spt5 [Candidatus Nanohaloarchaeota archaeon QJJ-5]|nr:transcription elongation factor Spt5 [Candidatus Nanohaloarchaeota archaeon QJJ-5]